MNQKQYRRYQLSNVMRGGAKEVDDFNEAVNKAVGNIADIDVQNIFGKRPDEIYQKVKNIVGKEDDFKKDLKRATLIKALKDNVKLKTQPTITLPPSYTYKNAGESLNESGAKDDLCGADKILFTVHLGFDSGAGNIRKMDAYVIDQATYDTLGLSKGTSSSGTDDKTQKFINAFTSATTPADFALVLSYENMEKIDLLSIEWNKILTSSRKMNDTEIDTINDFILNVSDKRDEETDATKIDRYNEIILTISDIRDN